MAGEPVVKLYLVVREDLSPGQQAVQAAHALREFVSQHPEEDARWYAESNTLAFLATQNEQSLLALVEKAGRLGVPFAPFHEPDRDDEMTAVAFGPSARKLVAGLRLALRCMGEGVRRH
jgi:hypothetical protein